MTLCVYSTHCYGEIGFTECIYISPGEQLMKNIAIVLYINTSLFLGGLHQWLYVLIIKIEWRNQTEIHEVHQETFSMGPLQKTLYSNLSPIKVPLCVEVVYRALLCRIMDPTFEHTSFFTFFSAILFSASHYINYYRLRKRYDNKFAFKTSCNSQFT